MSKRVIALVVVASVFIVGIWYVAVYSSQSHSIKTANARTTASNSQAASLRSQIAVLQQEQTQLPQATAKLSTLALALPDTPALDKLVDDVNAAAAKSGVDWQTIGASKPTTFVATTEQAVTVTMAVNGTYSQVTDFVTQLNGISRLLTVDSVNFNGVGGTTKTTAQISTQIFFIPPPPAVAATTTTVAP